MGHTDHWGKVGLTGKRTLVVALYSEINHHDVSLGIFGKIFQLNFFYLSLTHFMDNLQSQVMLAEAAVGEANVKWARPFVL